MLQKGGPCSAYFDYRMRMAELENDVLPWSSYMFDNFFRNLLKHYKLNGVCLRMHGNRKRKPWNAASLSDKERAVKFITNYAEVHALPLPGRMPHFTKVV